jgi:hypothetical protein
MNQMILVLFVIPIISIVVVVMYQFWDEMFKKKFIIDRRARLSAAQSPIRHRKADCRTSPSRRYADPLASASRSETIPEPSTATTALVH